MSWQKNVFSSMISVVGWDDETNEITVEFTKGGAVWAYSGASEGLADQLARAPSVGSMFLSEIKPNYPGRRIA